MTEAVTPRLSVEDLILREFRLMKLPGLEVRTSPGGRTFVHLPTTFAVTKPKKDREIGPILGHRVTVSIRPMSYEWSFGDGSVRTTKAKGTHAPDSSVRHTFMEPGSVSASVQTTYRAQYRVDGGSPRDFEEPVPVDGPVTALPVEEARTELVAPPS